MGLIEDKLTKLGIYLEPPQPPVANYLGSKQIGDLLFVSGRKSTLTGKIGKDVTEEQAKDAARDTVVLMLSIIKHDIHDLDLLEGVVKVQGFMRCSKKFDRLPQVLDGASDLLIALFGEQGKHARTATGASQLPFGATVQLDMILKIKSDK